MVLAGDLIYASDRALLGDPHVLFGIATGDGAAALLPNMVSLTKAKDNDAERWDRYCDHCAGWIGPIMDKTGYHLVYDVIDRDKPQCHMRVFKDEAKAREAEMDVRLLMGWPGRKQES